MLYLKFLFLSKNLYSELDAIAIKMPYEGTPSTPVLQMNSESSSSHTMFVYAEGYLGKILKENEAEERLKRSHLKLELEL